MVRTRITRSADSGDHAGRYKDNSNKKALIIAVSEYNTSDLDALPFCREDGKAIHHILRNGGYSIPSKWKLTGNVSGRVIRKTIFDFFRKSANLSDTLLFYFSGHGVIDEYDDTFLASSDIDLNIIDETGYNLLDLAAILKKSQAKNAAVILDCCFSGSIGLGKDGRRESLEATKTIERTIDEDNGRCILASSLDRQSSFKMKGLEHSTFTYYLIEGLKGGNGEAIDDSGSVTPTTLSRYIYHSMPLDIQRPVTKIRMSGDFEIMTHRQMARVKHIVEKLSQRALAISTIAADDEENASSLINDKEFDWRVGPALNRGSIVAVYIPFNAKKFDRKTLGTIPFIFSVADATVKASKASTWNNDVRLSNRIVLETPLSLKALTTPSVAKTWGLPKTGFRNVGRLRRPLDTEQALIFWRLVLRNNPNIQTRLKENLLTR